jgi:hypothetical protein
MPNDYPQATITTTTMSVRPSSMYIPPAPASAPKYRPGMPFLASAEGYAQWIRWTRAHLEGTVTKGKGN